jgi:tripartite-type tricarboxylate transporter receptor subunit TctC
MTFGSLAGLMPFVRSGQLRALCACNEKRTQLAPDMPTLSETIPDLYANAWYGLFVPTGTPKEIVTKLNTEIIKLMDNPEMRERLVDLGVESAPSTPDQLATLMREDLVRWAKIVKDSGAQLD